MSILESIFGVQEFRASIGSVDCYLKKNAISTEFRANQFKFMFMHMSVPKIVFPEHVVVLMPLIQSEGDIHIVAPHVIALNAVHSTHAKVDITTAGKFFNLFTQVESKTLSSLQAELLTKIKEGSCDKVLQTVINPSSVTAEGRKIP